MTHPIFNRFALPTRDLTWCDNIQRIYHPDKYEYQLTTELLMANDHTRNMDSYTNFESWWEHYKDQFQSPVAVVSSTTRVLGISLGYNFFLKTMHPMIRHTLTLARITNPFTSFLIGSFILSTCIAGSMTAFRAMSEGMSIKEASGQFVRGMAYTLPGMLIGMGLMSSFGFGQRILLDLCLEPVQATMNVLTKEVCDRLDGVQEENKLGWKQRVFIELMEGLPYFITGNFVGKGVNKLFPSRLATVLPGPSKPSKQRTIPYINEVISLYEVSGQTPLRNIEFVQDYAAYKFGDPQMVKYFGGKMAALLHRRFKGEVDFFDEVVLVGVPQKKLGFVSSNALINDIARRLGVPHYRIYKTDHVSMANFAGMNAQDRLRLMQERKMKFADGVSVAGKHVIFVDDAVNTGLHASSVGQFAREQGAKRVSSISILSIKTERPEIEAKLGVEHMVDNFERDLPEMTRILETGNAKHVVKYLLRFPPDKLQRLLGQLKQSIIDQIKRNLSLYPVPDECRDTANLINSFHQ